MMYLSVLVIVCLSSSVFARIAPLQEIIDGSLKQINDARSKIRKPMPLQKSLRTPYSPRVKAYPNVQYGWYEQVFYGTSTCTNPYLKSVVALNTCGDMVSIPGVYGELSATADPDTHLYTVYEEYVNTGGCEGEVCCDTVSWQEPILICTDNTLTHCIDQPLNATTDNLGGLALGVYSTQTDCLENSSDDFSGLLEYMYYSLNLCYANAAGDAKFTSCSPTGGYSFIRYSSTNGSCTGSAYSYVQTPSEMCTTSTEHLSVFYGWENYICENQ